MPSFTSTAPGKIILFGEHAVVYGRPAIAAPVPAVRARAVVSADPRAPAGTVTIDAPGIELKARLIDLGDRHPLAAAVLGVQHALGLERIPACSIRVTSTIPVASGLGSGAAVSVAVLRALSAFLGRPLPDERVCDLAYQVEKIYHGTPSGIDNTVITYNMPVFFQRSGQESDAARGVVEPFRAVVPFTVVIGDTGTPSPTAKSVGDVRTAWLAEPARLNALFDSVGEIVLEARRLIQEGKPELLGPLMDRNHRLLGEIGVSSAGLDRLVEAARNAGALGAKLSGGGRGGNMIALVQEETAPQVENALRAAGAVRTIVTSIL